MWLRRSASAVVGAGLVVPSLDWPGLGTTDQGKYLAGGTVLGLCLGVFWQLVARRDLADRLILVAFVTVIAGFLPLMAEGGIRYRPATTHTALALVAGLVLTEQWLRWRRPDEQPADVGESGS
jgi:hypothetical protein